MILELYFKFYRIKFEMCFYPIACVLLFSCFLVFVFLCFLFVCFVCFCVLFFFGLRLNLRFLIIKNSFIMNFNSFPNDLVNISLCYMYNCQTLCSKISINQIPVSTVRKSLFVKINLINDTGFI